MNENTYGPEDIDVTGPILERIGADSPERQEEQRKAKEEIQKRIDNGEFLNIVGLKVESNLPGYKRPPSPRVIHFAQMTAEELKEIENCWNEPPHKSVRCAGDAGDKGLAGKSRI